MRVRNSTVSVRSPTGGLLINPVRTLHKVYLPVPTGQMALHVHVWVKTHAPVALIAVGTALRFVLLLFL